MKSYIRVNTLRPRQNGRLFADDTLKRIFLNENIRISIKISLKFVPKGPINNIPALVQIIAWRRSGGKPLAEPMMVSLLTHICVTRPQWVKVKVVKHALNIIQRFEQYCFVWIEELFPARRANDKIHSCFKCVYYLINTLSSLYYWADFITFQPISVLRIQWRYQYINFKVVSYILNVFLHHILYTPYNCINNTYV